MSRMRAYRIQRFGGPDVLDQEQIDVPEIAPGEVLAPAVGQIPPGMVTSKSPM